MNQKGFINIILVILVIALVGAGAYFVSTIKITPPTPTPPPTPSPTSTISLLPPHLTEPGLTSCTDLQQRINVELLKVNYCSSDNDCSSERTLNYGEDGEFRCGDGVPNYYHNKNADTKTLKQLGQQYAANQCPAAPDGGCRGPREDEIAQVACVKNRCVLTFTAKLNSLQNTSYTTKWGCKLVSQGTLYDPNNPPPTVCGYIPVCPSGLHFLVANLTEETWPDGSLKGTFSCSSEFPP